ncbi:MAG TPA: DUF309 domain-containing protein [Longimicrobiales bacterium]|nr:DUF309 domain-containing protein [Longimicrobiales bacterium]
MPSPTAPQPPDALVAFVELFARGEFWEGHEALEAAWRANRSGFYKGLILLASAFVHVGRGNAHGVGAQLAKAERELAPYAPAYLGIDVAALLEVARRGQALARAHPRAGTEAWRRLLPAPRIVIERARIRGNEAELRDGA